MAGGLVYRVLRAPRIHFARLQHMQRFISTEKSVADIYENHRNGEVHCTVKGWVRAVRQMKERVFFDVNDGSCIHQLQVVIPKSEANPSDLNYGCSVEVSGKVCRTPTGKPEIELVAENVSVLGPCVVTEGYPFIPRQVHPPEYVRQHLHLRPRTSFFSSLLRIRDAASRAFHEYFGEKGYIGVHTPILTANDCEGAGEVFMVKPASTSLIKTMQKEGVPEDESYFDTKAYLTVSGQLHLEAAARGMGKVYTFGPTFRAENSRSRRHLSEFYMIEAEVAFLDNTETLLSVVQDLLKAVTQKLLQTCEKDFAVFEKAPHSMNKGMLKKMTENQFVVLTYEEAFAILNAHLNEFKGPPSKEEGLSKEHEIFLVKHSGDLPVFVIDWPAVIKPFYMKQIPNSPLKVAAFDLLAPNVGELCGGSLREDNYQVLDERLQKLGLGESLSWYSELRKFGNAPTGGFGIGFERYLQLLLGVGNIKDTIPFPRWPHNCKM